MLNKKGIEVDKLRKRYNTVFEEYGLKEKEVNILEEEISIISNKRNELIDKLISELLEKQIIENELPIKVFSKTM